MQKPKHHLFVCASFRMNGEPQGVCRKKGSQDLLQLLEREISDRGIGGVSISSTGCLKACDRGPVMIVYPENWWYGNVAGEEAIAAILDALEEDRPAEQYLLG
jgi:(2Fe-2S) ferredoxin